MNNNNEKSNLIAGSNVYHCRDDSPWYDNEFLQHVFDIDLLKKIGANQKFDSRIHISGIQGSLLKHDKRCINAKNDPCWGYDDQSKKVKCTCINDNCPHIYKCNPSFTDEYKKIWNADAFEALSYGDPEKLQKYYLVDIVSDDEILKYDNNLEFKGRMFSAEYHKVNEEKKNEPYDYTPQISFDPKTGKKIQVVGYQWKCVDNSYEDMQLFPIWAYVEETTPVKLQKKSNKIDKKDLEKAKSEKKLDSELVHSKKVLNDKLSAEERKKYETYVQSLLKEKIEFTDITLDDFQYGNTVIIFANPAEQRYASSILIKKNIMHGYDNREDILLIAGTEYKASIKADSLIISSTFLDEGCKSENIDLWKFLSTQKNLRILDMPEREYYMFTDADVKPTWCCRNMYNVTHVYLDESSIENFDVNKDGIYNLLLIEDNDKKNYKIVNNNNFVGNTNCEFYSLMKSMEKKREIPGTPAYIDGIYIIRKNGNNILLGIGHLKFMEY